MSAFWSTWVIVLTTINIAACFWLIRWTAKPRPGEAEPGEITGHTWDGDLAEYNNPMPRWWLWMFYISLVFSIGYLVLYPGMGNVVGALGWTQITQYEEEVAAAEEKYGPLFERYSNTDIPTLAADPEAVSIGQRLFLNYCSTCHGSDARGARGFPNLTDEDWLYGGSPEAIETSILQGRSGAMPALGAVLGEEGVEQVAAYVMSLGGRVADAAMVEAGKQRFALCAGCHMPTGTGNHALGAPNLTDNIWLYGGSVGWIKQSIREGRNGKMPPHGDFLGTDKAHLLASYVYSLSQ